jgi:hypothetical protein
MDMLMVRELALSITRRNNIFLPVGAFITGLAVTSLLSFATLGTGIIPPMAAISIGVLGLGTVGVAWSAMRSLREV